jgi:hypothetical protein
MRPALSTLLIALLVTRVGASEITIRDALVLGPVSRGGRTAISIDPIEAMRVHGQFRAPHEDDSVELRGERTVTWKTVAADKDGWISSDSLGGGRVCVCDD